MSGAKIFSLVMFVVLVLAAFAGRKIYYGGRRRFRVGEETYIWVPDGEMNWNPFVKDYGGGHFLFEDETPVTDELQIGGLREYWTWRNKPRGF